MPIMVGKCNHLGLIKSNITIMVFHHASYSLAIIIKFPQKADPLAPGTPPWIQQIILLNTNKLELVGN